MKGRKIPAFDRVRFGSSTIDVAPITDENIFTYKLDSGVIQVTMSLEDAAQIGSQTVKGVQLENLLRNKLQQISGEILLESFGLSETGFKLSMSLQWISLFERAIATKQPMISIPPRVEPLCRQYFSKRGIGIDIHDLDTIDGQQANEFTSLTVFIGGAEDESREVSDTIEDGKSEGS